jgi:hypothetical protein
MIKYVRGHPRYRWAVHDGRWRLISRPEAIQLTGLPTAAAAAELRRLRTDHPMTYHGWCDLFSIL